MLLRLQESGKKITEQQILLKNAELKTLQAQINPHFLYNTLDTIYMLARINGEETTMKMIQALSKYLRLSLSKGSDIVTVEDELENVKKLAGSVPVEAIDMRDYGMMNGEKVLKHAMEVMG